MDRTRDSFLVESPEIIEGIGPKRGQALSEAGISNIAQLFTQNPAVAHTAMPKLSHQQVANLYRAAVLLRINDMTADLAEALVDAGVKSVEKVAESGLQTLERAVKEAADKGKISSPPSLYRLAEYQRDAWRARDKGMVAGRLTATNGDPIPNIDVTLAGDTTQTGADGWYGFDRVPEGNHTLKIFWSGRMEPIHHSIRDLAAAKLHPLVHHKINAAAPSNPIERLEDEATGQSVVFHFGDRIDTIIVPIDSFDDGTLLKIRHLYRDGRARLLDFNKRRVGRVIQIRRAIVAGSELPDNAKVSDILKWENGALVSTTLSDQDLRAQRRQRQLGNVIRREYRRVRL